VTCFNALGPCGLPRYRRTRALPDAGIAGRRHCRTSALPDAGIAGHTKFGIIAKIFFFA
jgi:hypothetical protein